ncbi:aldose epimerase family protein [Sphingobacterium sp. JB170]|uniref:aldose epimerase family protein n=1 Tax=Sphingobacterium sp. JB170 TaxID=1434842 RepID=UPI00097EC517|nr:aldose epimerase family protein [Sphingobacterium sp. JB170]SJN18279.1 Aldose 1-epimerase [Sphingobacterium sp. JB170]
MKVLTNVIFFLIVVIVISCDRSASYRPKSGLRSDDFRQVVDGKQTDLFTIRNKSGMEACITNFGGRIVSLMVPDKDGDLQDVVLGFDNISEYLKQPSSFGATVGRVANRIAYGKFMLDSDTVRLDINSGKHTIHGGAEGWQNQVFSLEKQSDSVLVLGYISKDGESGFPGTANLNVTFTMADNNSLRIDYKVNTDKKTVVNMTNHSFFNLSGDPSQKISDHVLFVDADRYTPLTSELIPTGALENVAASPFDFTKPRQIAKTLSLNDENQQLRFTRGLDHNFVLNSGGDLSILAAKVYSPKTGIALEVFTTEPGLQVYTGNMLDGTRTGKKSKIYTEQTAICLEPQHFPDSPNRPQWPSVTLDPKETYQSTSIYRFAIEK